YQFPPLALPFRRTGILNAPKTIPQTHNIATPPTVYAVSLPPHQNKVQNKIGPAARPAWPQLRKRPKKTPRSPSPASKLPRLFRPVTTVALVTASRHPAT